jgi:hypothetical protein
MAIFLTAAIGLGCFLLGVLGFRIKSRWCPACGAMTFRDKPCVPIEMTGHLTRHQ